MATASRVLSKAETAPSRANSQPAMPLARQKGRSNRTRSRALGMAVMRAGIPRASSRLNVLLPKTLPRAKPVWSSPTATRLTTNSGALVPMATMVSPTHRGDTPARRLRRTAPRTKASAPTESSARPPSTLMTSQTITRGHPFHWGPSRVKAGASRASLLDVELGSPRWGGWIGPTAAG